MCNTTQGAYKYYKTSKLVKAYKIFAQNQVNRLLPDVQVGTDTIITSIVSMVDNVPYLSNSKDWIVWKEGLLPLEMSGSKGFCAFSTFEDAKKCLDKWNDNYDPRKVYRIWEIACFPLFRKIETQIFDTYTPFDTYIVSEFRLIRPLTI